MHGASNIMKSGNQFTFLRKYLRNTTFTIFNTIYTTIYTIRTILVTYSVLSLTL
jgi:hypothetical protein